MAERSSVVEYRAGFRRGSRSAPRNSRASRSCSKARTPRPRSPRAPPAAPRSTPRWPSSTPAATEPSVGWRRDYSLMLGLERVLAEDEPHLVDGTVLSAHQVDALSGTLIALTAELLVPSGPRGSNGACGGRGAALRRGRAGGRRAHRRGAARLGPGRGGRGGGSGGRRPGGPGRQPALLVRACHRGRQDRGRARLRRGVAHRRRPDPHSPPQPRGPVPGRAARPRLPRPHLCAAAAPQRRRAAGGRTGDRRDLSVVRAQRRARSRTPTRS